MLKIYNAIGENGKVVLKKGIQFRHGGYNTGNNGYGTIISGRSDCKRADYIFEALESFKEGIAHVDKVDGWIKNNSFILYNPYSLEELNSQITEDRHLDKDLDEEGILLFTDYVNVSYDKDLPLVKKMIGRWPEYAGFILLPGAELEMNFPAYEEKSTNHYEVLESGSKPKQLYLTKKDRNLF